MDDFPTAKAEQRLLSGSQNVNQREREKRDLPSNPRHYILDFFCLLSFAKLTGFTILVHTIGTHVPEKVCGGAARSRIASHWFSLRDYHNLSSRFTMSLLKWRIPQQALDHGTYGGTACT